MMGVLRWKQDQKSEAGQQQQHLQQRANGHGGTIGNFVTQSSRDERQSTDLNSSQVIHRPVPPGQALMKEVLRKAKNGSKEPIPLVVVPEGYWVDGEIHEHFIDSNGKPLLPPLPGPSRIDQDNTIKCYREFFAGRDHMNLVGKTEDGSPILASLKPENIAGKDVWRVVLRIPKGTVHQLIATKDLTLPPTPAVLIKHVDGTIKPITLTPVLCSGAASLIAQYDEHAQTSTYKFGVIQQRYGQITEEEMFANEGISPAFREFLDSIGRKIELKDHDGYSGGLDTKNGQTGEYTYYEVHRGKQVVFHVSEMLPQSPTDPQQLQRKRHIGNDIIGIVFQEKPTPFSPDMIASNFLHAFIVVQVIDPCTSYTRYKVSVTAREAVPWFGPELPTPAVFAKGPEFKEFFLTKLVNAETAAYKSGKFATLGMRTRESLLDILIDVLQQQTMIFMGNEVCPGLFEQGGSGASSGGTAARLLDTFRKILGTAPRRRNGSMESVTSQVSKKDQVVPSSPSTLSISSPVGMRYIDSSTSDFQSISDTTLVKNTAPSTSKCQEASLESQLQVEVDRREAMIKTLFLDDIGINGELEVEHLIYVDSDTGMESMSSADAQEAGPSRENGAQTETPDFEDEIDHLKREKLQLLKENVSWQMNVKRLRERELDLHSDLVTAKKEIIRLQAMLKEG